jgi:hypothetical protein
MPKGHGMSQGDSAKRKQIGILCKLLQRSVAYIFSPLNTPHRIVWLGWEIKVAVVSRKGTSRMKRADEQFDVIEA